MTQTNITTLQKHTLDPLREKFASKENINTSLACRPVCSPGIP